MKVSTTTLHLHNLRSSSFNDKQTQRPLSPQVFNSLKDLDILHRSRGQRGGRYTNNLRPKPLPYFTTLPSSSNVTTATPHFHNLRSSSLNIQDCKKHVSKSFPRGNYNHHSSTRMLTNISTTRQSHSFPTFFLSNTRSMVNKLDEINATIVNNKSDVAVITESWLSTNITDDLIMIPGFRSVRKDRPDNQRGGGICTYIKETLDFIELNYLSDPVFETQWFLLKPNRFPRGINSIIMATVYHPPQNNDLELKKYLFQSLDSALAKFPNAVIVILGDFNNLNPGSVISSFNLKQRVKKPTRGNNILDKIYTTLSKYYTDAMILPCIGQSDHSSVLLSPATQSPTPYSPAYITKRDCRPANRRPSLQLYPKSTGLLSTTQLQLIISLVFFQIHYPLFSILIFHYAQLSTILKTNPGLLQIPRITFPKDKRLGLLETLSSTTSTVIKLGNCANLSASSFTTAKSSIHENQTRKNGGPTSNIFLGYPNQNLFQASSITVSSKEVLSELADLIAESFCNVSNSLPPLQFNKLPISSVPDEYIISPGQVEIELENISLQKATSPDDIPGY